MKLCEYMYAIFSTHILTHTWHLDWTTLKERTHKLDLRFISQPKPLDLNIIPKNWDKKMLPPSDAKKRR